MAQTTLRGDISVQLDQDGDSRYTAYLSRPGKGRVRIGTVLGGNRSWSAELVGRVPPIRGTTRAAVTRALGYSGLAQPAASSLRAEASAHKTASATFFVLRARPP